MTLKHCIILFLIILGSSAIRFYQLDQIPAGLNIDESSMGYNAYSILSTGKDRFGQFLPILFRSSDSFQSPLYTYLTIIPIWLFGNTAFSVHFISAISGLIVVIATFLIILFCPFKNISDTRKIRLALFSSAFVGFAPWSILFSRMGTEATLGLTFFVTGILFLVVSLRRSWMLVIACLIFGLSTHAYYSERILGPLFLFIFLIFFYKKYSENDNKKWLYIGLSIFFVTQLPHLMIFESGAFTRRMNQVEYLSDDFFLKNSGSLASLPLGKYIYILREFASQYASYLSPKNLFFYPDPQEARSIPDLSVLYNWMVIPVVFGINFFLRNKNWVVSKIILTVLIIGPIPASLTRDPFYTLRVLGFLWGLTIMIAFGADTIFQKIVSYSKYILLIVVAGYSFWILLSAYFVLFKYERAENFGYSYIKLINRIKYLGDKTVIIDTARNPGVGIRMAFIMGYDPLRLQRQLKPQVGNDYYGSSFSEDQYYLGNIEARSIIWGKDTSRDTVLVGDYLAVSEQQAQDHKLSQIFEIKDITGKVRLKGYQINPELKKENQAVEDE